MSRVETGDQNFFDPDAGAAQVPSVLPQPQAPASPSPIQTTKESFTWTAPEFIAHHKTGGWYGALILVAVVLCVGVWFITKDIFLTITIAVGVTAFGIYAARSPKEQTYTIDDSSLTIGARSYGYGDFGAFSVMPEGAMVNIEFAPLKRFAVPTNIYIHPKDEQTVVELLSLHLPLTPPRNDLTDRLMRSIKF